MSTEKINPSTNQSIEGTQSESNQTLRTSSLAQRRLDDATHMEEIFKCPVSVNVTGDGMSASFIIGVPRVPQEKVIFVKPTNNNP